MNYIWLFDQQRFRIPLKDLRWSPELFYFVLSLLFPMDWELPQQPDETSPVWLKSLFWGFLLLLFQELANG